MTSAGVKLPPSSMRARIWEPGEHGLKSHHKSQSAYLANVVEGKGDGAIGSRAGTVLATEQELEAGSTGAVGDTDSACKLDEVGDGNTRMSSDELFLECYDLVRAAVSGHTRVSWHIRESIGGLTRET